jgi:inosose dehydratase
LFLARLTSRSDIILNPSRRAFLAALGAVPFAGIPLAQSSSSIRFGYAAITWGGEDVKAIEGVGAVGFRGIQLRATAVQRFGDRPAELKELLAKHRVAFAVLSSGNLGIDPAREAAEMTVHTNHAKFVRDAGGTYIQVIDQRPKRELVGADYRRLGQLLTELGKRTADIGIPLVYHHHMNSIGERPREIDAVMDATDDRHAKLLFDTAHYQQGGGDPVAGIRKYADRIAVFHIKDLESPILGATRLPAEASANAALGAEASAKAAYRFVELGRGKVDLKGVFAAITKSGFRGWAIVELDRVPDPSRTPKESAIIARDYLQRELRFTI